MGGQTECAQAVGTAIGPTASPQISLTAWRHPRWRQCIETRVPIQPTARYLSDKKGPT